MIKAHTFLIKPKINMLLILFVKQLWQQIFVTWYKMKYKCDLGLYIYIYIYIYTFMCVCVCVCVFQMFSEKSNDLVTCAYVRTK